MQNDAHQMDPTRISEKDLLTLRRLIPRRVDRRGRLQPHIAYQLLVPAAEIVDTCGLSNRESTQTRRR